MPELVYHVACTLDGFIAQPDGATQDFCWDDELVSDFLAEQSGYGTVLMGRKTYEVGLAAGKASPYPELRQIVFSQTLREAPDAAIELVSGDPAVAFGRIKAGAERPIWLCGGSMLATRLLEAGLIDEVVLKLNPTLFGDGIPLFGMAAEPVSLSLIDQKTYRCGVIRARYAVGNRPMATTS